jgi:hypothetical protein
VSLSLKYQQWQKLKKNNEEFVVGGTPTTAVVRVKIVEWKRFEFIQFKPFFVLCFGAVMPFSFLEKQSHTGIK